MGSFDGLLVLQRLDTQADQLRHRRSHLAERATVTALDAEARDAEARLGVARAQRHELERAQRRLEDEAAGVQAKRADVDRRLRVVTVPREAQALSADADALARHQGELEDRILEVMLEAEPLDGQIGALEDELRDLGSGSQAARDALAGAEAVIDADLDDVVRRRGEAAGSVAPAALAEYERLRARLDGVAVTTLDGHTCTGCHVALPVSEVERIRKEPPDALVWCEPCGRIVVRA